MTSRFETVTGAASLAVDIRHQHRGAFELSVRLVAGPGETIAVMGPSGAGKSTLLALIAGHVRVEDGTISVGDRTVSDAAVHVRPEQREVVLLGQDPLLFPHLSVRENVAFGPRARGVPREHARTEADAWLARVGLDGAGDRAPADLSGGQQQRVALARALITSPRVLLLDEPLTSLDAITADEVRAVLQLALRGVTALIVTHDPLDATALADRLIVIEGGVITQDGPVRQALAEPRTGFTASIAGVNRLTGEVRAGAWTCLGVSLALAGNASQDASAQHAALADGTSAAAVIHPGDVELEPADASAPAPPGAWRARIVRLQHTPAGVRVYLDSPALFVDLSLEAARDLVEGSAAYARPRAWRIVPANL